jgi:hypothetical protein
MTSQINPNNINGAYPVAGQDNNSQGFRDNFTNTSTNFSFAAQEITDLQSKVVVNSQLTGGAALSTQNNMLNSPLTNALVANFAYTTVALGTVSGSFTVNYAAGHYQTVTLGASSSLAFTNWPIAGQAGFVNLQVTVSNTAYTLTLPAAVSVNTTGVQGLNPSTNVMTFAATGVYSLTFTSNNNGATVTLSQVNQLLQPLNASSQTLASGGTASLGTTTSYFTTAGTATLAAGVEGQIKVFTQTAASVSMVVTVSNAGWKAAVPGTSGTITLASRGTGCTLQYTNSVWYCIGNNGCTFA